MNIQDPVGDMLTRIRNAQARQHGTVNFPVSSIKLEILRVLMEEGYIVGYETFEKDGHGQVAVDLKYYQGRPVIEKLRRISRPGLRVYKNAKSLPRVSGFGIAILTTSQGVMTHMNAQAKGIGGEVICEVA